MNNQELKPCPFCGNESVSIQSESDHPEYGSGGRFYYVRCPSCRAQSGSKYAHEVCPIFYSEVRQEWNNRASPPAPFVVKAPEFKVHAQHPTMAAGMRDNDWKEAIKAAGGSVAE